MVNPDLSAGFLTLPARPSHPEGQWFIRLNPDGLALQQRVLFPIFTGFPHAQIQVFVSN
jgi:hypothetical protein